MRREISKVIGGKKTRLCKTDFFKDGTPAAQMTLNITSRSNSNTTKNKSEIIAV